MKGREVAKNVPNPLKYAKNQGFEMANSKITRITSRIKLEMRKN